MVGVLCYTATNMYVYPPTTLFITHMACKNSFLHTLSSLLRALVVVITPVCATPRGLIAKAHQRDMNLNAMHQIEL